MIVKVANEAEWQRAHKHTLEFAPREIGKDYKDYTCVVAIEGDELMAYAFYIRCGNTLEIHHTSLNVGSEDALRACIMKVAREADEANCREVITFVARDDKRGIDFLKNLGFDCNFYLMQLRTKTWWRNEGLDYDKLQQRKREI